MAQADMVKGNVVVIGAGVIGLSTALKIQDAGYKVLIVADHIPGDPKSIHYTSSWAGAHHVSAAGDDLKQRKMDQDTFKVMWDMSINEAEQCFMRLPQYEYYMEDQIRPNGLEEMPDFRHLEASELWPGTKSGVSFTTVTIDTAVYLPYLLAKVYSKGGKVARNRIQHISQVIDGAFSYKDEKPDAVVVCAGIGARSLGGIEDQDIYPVRGQTVLIRAPWITFGRTLSSSDGLWTYIIPRRSGDVILGGSKVVDDWYPHPRPDQTQSILERSLALCPELVPPHLREAEPSRKFTPADISPLILEEGCGLRPARKGGIRLELEQVTAADGRKIPVITNYGHGGYGYQSSWGSASIALERLEDALHQ